MPNLMTYYILQLFLIHQVKQTRVYFNDMRALLINRCVCTSIYSTITGNVKVYILFKLEFRFYFFTKCIKLWQQRFVNLKAVPFHDTSKVHVRQITFTFSANGVGHSALKHVQNLLSKQLLQFNFWIKFSHITSLFS